MHASLMQICSNSYHGDCGMYVSSLISLAPLTPGKVTEQGPGMNTRYSQPMILQVNQSFRTSSNQHAQSCYHVFNKTLVRLL